MAAGLPNIPPTVMPAAMPLPQGTPTPINVMQHQGPPMPPAPTQGGGIGDQLQQMLMTFLAGIGFPQFAATIEKLKKPAGEARSHHKPGIQADAAGAPTQQMNPAIAQLLAKSQMMQGQGGPM